MYKNLAATFVVARFIAPVFPRPAAGTPILGIGLLAGVQDGFTP